MATLRVREEHNGSPGPWIVTHPDHGAQVVLAPGDPWDSTDPVVKRFKWAFQTDASRDVEDASAPPGKKRTTKRPA